MYISEIWYTLGQAWVLQLPFSMELPEHWFPPNCGVGLLHDRDLDLDPPPQFTEHSLHPPHPDQPPWTKSIQLRELLIITKENLLLRIDMRVDYVLPYFLIYLIKNKIKKFF